MLPLVFSQWNIKQRHNSQCSQNISQTKDHTKQAKQNKTKSPASPFKNYGSRAPTTSHSPRNLDIYSSGNRPIFQPIFSVFRDQPMQNLAPGPWLGFQSIPFLKANNSLQPGSVVHLLLQRTEQKVRARDIVLETAGVFTDNVLALTKITSCIFITCSHLLFHLQICLVWRSNSLNMLWEQWDIYITIIKGFLAAINIEPPCDTLYKKLDWFFKRINKQVVLN